MDSEAATENEWSESESETSEHDDVREARVHVAAQFSDTATMREELEAGENPNVRDYDGSTPLYLVCLFADKSRNEAATIECIRLLLAHDAKVQDELGHNLTANKSVRGSCLRRPRGCGLPDARRCPHCGRRLCQGACGGGRRLRGPGG